MHGVQQLVHVRLNLENLLAAIRQAACNLLTMLIMNVNAITLCCKIDTSKQLPKLRLTLHAGTPAVLTTSPPSSLLSYANDIHNL